jgi:hypothetical protein
VPYDQYGEIRDAIETSALMAQGSVSENLLHKAPGILGVVIDFQAEGLLATPVPANAKKGVRDYPFSATRSEFPVRPPPTQFGIYGSKVGSERYAHGIDTEQVVEVAVESRGCLVPSAHIEIIFQQYAERRSRERINVLL